MSSEVRQAIEAAIDRHDGGDGAPVGMVIESATRECGFGPTLSKARTLYVKGEIYTVGDDRLKLTAEEGSALVADGGKKAQVVDIPDEDPRTMPPDPKTAHPDFLLGRTVEIDFGSNVREGEIRQVKDHAVQARWISAKPDQGGMILADPEEHEIEFVDGERDD